MRKLLLFLTLLAPFIATAQNYSPTTPAGSSPATMTIRTVAGVTDSLLTIYGYVGGKYYKIPTGVQADGRYIYNQFDAPQSGSNFWISGSGRVNDFYIGNSDPDNTYGYFNQDGLSYYNNGVSGVYQFGSGVYLSTGSALFNLQNAGTINTIDGSPNEFNSVLRAMNSPVGSNDVMRLSDMDGFIKNQTATTQTAGFKINGAGSFINGTTTSINGGVITTGVLVGGSDLIDFTSVGSGVFIQGGTLTNNSVTLSNTSVSGRSLVFKTGTTENAYFDYNANFFGKGVTGTGFTISSAPTNRTDLSTGSVTLRNSTTGNIETVSPGYFASAADLAGYVPIANLTNLTVDGTLAYASGSSYNTTVARQAGLNLSSVNSWAADIRAATDNTYNLGTFSNNWAILYTHNIRSNSTISFDTNTGSAIQFSTSGTEKIRINGTSGNLLLGGTVDGGYKINAIASGTNGYLKAGSLSVNASGVVNVANLTASQAVFTDASKNLVSNAILGTGSVVMSSALTFVSTNGNNLSNVRLYNSGLNNLTGTQFTYSTATEPNKPTSANGLNLIVSADANISGAIFLNINNEVYTRITTTGSTGYSSYLKLLTPLDGQAKGSYWSNDGSNLSVSALNTGDVNTFLGNQTAYVTTSGTNRPTAASLWVQTFGTTTTGYRGQIGFTIDGELWTHTTTTGDAGYSSWSKLLTNADLSGYATISSPTFTGVPRAPTASAGTNTTQIATTAFVQANAGGSSTRVVYSAYTDVNSTAGTTNVYSYTIPANTLQSNGQLIEGFYSGRLATQASSSRAITISIQGISGTSIPIPNTIAGSDPFTLVFQIFRTGTTTARLFAKFQTGVGSGTIQQPVSDLTGLDWTTTAALTAVVTGVTASDITFNTGYYKFNP